MTWEGAARMSVVERVDHLVLATDDVARSIDELEARLGVRAVMGGRHPAWGTHNALIALGARVYLEIVGPDPEAPTPARARPFGLDAPAPRLATWAAHATRLDRLVERARRSGVELGESLAQARRRPDGTLLQWTMTDPLMPREGGVIPFFIDWGVSPHPATTSPGGGRLLALAARHPDPAGVRAKLESLGLDLDVGPGAGPELIATLEGLRGTIELR